MLGTNVFGSLTLAGKTQPAAYYNIDRFWWTCLCTGAVYTICFSMFVRWCHVHQLVWAWLCSGAMHTDLLPYLFANSLCCSNLIEDQNLAAWILIPNFVHENRTRSFHIAVSVLCHWTRSRACLLNHNKLQIALILSPPPCACYFDFFPTKLLCAFPLYHLQAACPTCNSV